MRTRLASAFGSGTAGGCGSGRGVDDGLGAGGGAPGERFWAPDFEMEAVELGLGGGGGSPEGGESKVANRESSPRSSSIPNVSSEGVRSSTVGSNVAETGRGDRFRSAAVTPGGGSPRNATTLPMATRPRAAAIARKPRRLFV